MPPLPGTSDPRSDVELVRAAQRGDPRAFEALYRRHRDWAARVALRFAGERHLALDAMQEAFLYLLRKLGDPSFTLTARFTTFLYPAVKHAAQAARRKAKRSAGGEEALPLLPAAPAAEADDAVAATLASLPEEHREVLTLRYVDDLSLAEIAEAMGVPLGTVKSRLHHGLKKLREDPRTKSFFGEA